MLRTVIALIAGFAIMTFAILIATIAAAMVMDISGPVPSPTFRVVNIATTALAALLGGYSTASLAPNRRTGHATMLALMIVAMQSYNVMNPQPGYPRTHFAWLAVLCPLAVLAGARIREAQLGRRTAGA